MKVTLGIKVICPRCQGECSVGLREVSEEGPVFDYYCDACDRWVATVIAVLEEEKEDEEETP